VKSAGLVSMVMQPEVPRVTVNPVSALLLKTSTFNCYEKSLNVASIIFHTFDFEVE
jgi:hypothetical protein